MLHHVSEGINCCFGIKLVSLFPLYTTTTRYPRTVQTLDDYLNANPQDVSRKAPIDRIGNHTAKHANETFELVQGSLARILYEIKQGNEDLLWDVLSPVFSGLFDLLNKGTQPLFLSLEKYCRKAKARGYGGPPQGGYKDKGEYKAIIEKGRAMIQEGRRAAAAALRQYGDQCG